MITCITLNNYKAFANETTIELRPITVLYGKNSSGKSSLCKLISILSKAFSSPSQPLLPLRNQEIVLGSRLEDVFHNNILTGLRIKTDFDDDIQVDAEFLMNEGKMYVRDYCVKRGKSSCQVSYGSIADFAADSYRGLINLRCFRKMGIEASNLSFSVDYIGPVRSSAKRAVFASDIMDADRVGFFGENTPYILLESYLGDKSLITNVSNWYKDNMEGQWIDVEEAGPGTGSFSFIMHRGKASVNFADVGEGHNQLLPIVTQSFAAKADLTIIEQPALHLHPSAHASIAYLLAGAAKRSGKKFLVESHSENFLLGLRKMVAEGNLKPDDVIVYYIEHDEDEAYAKTVEIEKNGELSYWPEGVFEEDFELLKDICRVER